MNVMGRNRSSLLWQRPQKFLTSRYHRRNRSNPSQESKTSEETGKRQQGSSIFYVAWSKYTSALLARPLTVKATTASVIFITSDCATQALSAPSTPWDASRSLSGGAFGVIATGWLHYWWGFLETFVARRLPVAQYRLPNTLVKVFLDQSIGAPFYIYTYYVITNFIQEWTSQAKVKQSQNQSPSDVLVKTHFRAVDMLLPTMLRHWTLWPAVHTLNFYFNPLHHRVLVQNLVLVGWSGYLSHLNNGGLMTPKEEIKVTETVKRRETLLKAKKQSKKAMQTR